MKRLLCIITALDAGGAETFLMKIFRVLPEEYKLDFIVFRGNGFYEKEVNSLGGKIYKVPTHSEKPFKVLWQIWSIIKNNRYENVLKMTDTPIGVFDVIAAKLGGASNICVRSCNAASDIGSIKKIICNFLRPVLNHLANQKVAPSELAGRYTFGNKEFEKEKIKLLRNGVDLNLFKFDDEIRDKIRLQYGIQNKFVVGNVGRYTEQKNHQFLISVFSEILKLKPNAMLMLVGDGEKKEAIVAQASKLGILDRIIFTGFKKNVASFYSAMDVYVHTAFYEGMPNTIIEAQSTGLNCVISDTITREVNITGNVQYLSLQNPEKWAECVNKCVISPREDVSKYFLEAGYDIESVKEQFIKLFFGENYNVE